MSDVEPSAQPVPDRGAEWTPEEPVTDSFGGPPAATVADETPVEPTADEGASDAAHEDGPARAARSHKKQKKSSFLRELPVLIVIALVLALLIKAFLIQAFFIPSGSMENTLQVKDRVLVNKLVYDFRDPHRGEIVVFSGKGTGFCRPKCTENQAFAAPTSWFGRFRHGLQRVLGFGAPNDKDFIKRVIGLPGDRMSCCDDKGRVTVNGVGLDEPYINNTSPGSPNTLPFSACQGSAQPAACVVPKSSLFVMGDHRDQSQDSRFNGPIPISRVIGRAFVVIWPPGHFKGLRVPRSIEKAKAMVVSPLGLGFAGALPITFVRRRRRNRRANRAR